MMKKQVIPIIGQRLDAQSFWDIHPIWLLVAWEILLGSLLNIKWLIALSLPLEVLRKIWWSAWVHSIWLNSIWMTSKIGSMVIVGLEICLFLMTTMRNYNLFFYLYSLKWLNNKKKMGSSGLLRRWFIDLERR